MLVSIIIRTLNEATYLNELLQVINLQIKDDFDIEIEDNAGNVSSANIKAAITPPNNTFPVFVMSFTYSASIILM